MTTTATKAHELNGHATPAPSPLERLRLAEASLLAQLEAMTAAAEQTGAGRLEAAERRYEEALAACERRLADAAGRVERRTAELAALYEGRADAAAADLRRAESAAAKPAPLPAEALEAVRDYPQPAARPEVVMALAAATAEDEGERVRRIVHEVTGGVLGGETTAEEDEGEATIERQMDAEVAERQAKHNATPDAGPLTLNDVDAGDEDVHSGREAELLDRMEAAHEAEQAAAAAKPKKPRKRRQG